MTTKPTLIFDFDGTIADTFAFLKQTAHDWIPGEQFDYLADKPLEALRHRPLRESLKEFKIPFSQLPSLVSLVHHYISNHLDQIPLIPGISQALTQLHQAGYNLGIVTSNHKKNTKQFLNQHQLNYFDFIYSSKHLFRKHQILKRVIKSKNLSTRRTLYIGDEARDIIAAHKAGLKIISVTWGLNTTKVLKSAHPDYLIHKPSELFPLLKNTIP